jgi:hypothetical protein
MAISKKKFIWRYHWVILFPQALKLCASCNEYCIGYNNHLKRGFEQFIMAMRKSQASRTVSNEIQNENLGGLIYFQKSFSICIKARYISFLEEICVRFVV